VSGALARQETEGEGAHTRQEAERERRGTHKREEVHTQGRIEAERERRGTHKAGGRERRCTHKGQETAFAEITSDSLPSVTKTQQQSMQTAESEWVYV
jgi:hypothetical protein